MLVVTRKRDEELVIGGNIVVKVCDIGHNKVRLGVICDRSVPVVRRELLEQRPEQQETIWGPVAIEGK